uniref:Uncharacterized protein n=1 Tax=Medicago truncatula TaxID=3880 RepID=B7FG58_MEDTR|nr:unknown [Medicago truncatula]
MVVTNYMSQFQYHFHLQMVAAFHFLIIPKFSCHSSPQANFSNSKLKLAFLSIKSRKQGANTT